MSLRVLQVDAGREWRGGQSQVRLLCRELHRTPDVDVRLVTRRGSLLAQRAAADGVTVSPTGWSIGLDPRALWRLIREIRRFAPQIIHAHDSHALLLSIAARRVARARQRAAIIGYRRRGTRSGAAVCSRLTAR